MSRSSGVTIKSPLTYSTSYRSESSGVSIGIMGNTLYLSLLIKNLTNFTDLNSTWHSLLETSMTNSVSYVGSVDRGSIRSDQRSIAEGQSKNSSRRSSRSGYSIASETIKGMTLQRVVVQLCACVTSK